MKTTKTKLVFIYILSILIFITLGLSNKRIEANPPFPILIPIQEPSYIFRGTVFLHIYELKTNRYINNNFPITAMITVYREAPFSQALASINQSDIIIQFNLIPNNLHSYLQSSTYTINVTQLTADNNILSPCMCNNNYCMECNKIKSNSCSSININQQCSINTSDRFRDRGKNTSGIVGFRTNDYYVSFMFY